MESTASMTSTSNDSSYIVSPEISVHGSCLPSRSDFIPPIITPVDSSVGAPTETITTSPESCSSSVQKMTLQQQLQSTFHELRPKFQRTDSGREPPAKGDQDAPAFHRLESGHRDEKLTFLNQLLITTHRAKSPVRDCNKGIIATSQPSHSTSSTASVQNTLQTMRQYLEDVGHITATDSRDAWFAITESRNGNAYYAAFHILQGSIGVQALLLPYAFTFLGWTGGILALSIATVWQMYTKWLLVRMHECAPGKRISRYLDLGKLVFGDKYGNLIMINSIFLLTVGTCVGLISFGGTSLKMFYESVCRNCNNPLTNMQWYVVVAIICLSLSQFPNLNSIAGVSLAGAILAVVYFTLVWTLSVSVRRPTDVAYEIIGGNSFCATASKIFNALGVFAFAFPGHNLVLEIQATMPSSVKRPAHVPMWKGAIAAFFITAAVCYFPLAIAGYWAFGDKVSARGVQDSLFQLEMTHVPRALLGATFFFISLNCVTCFQLYSMPIFDLLDQFYTNRTNKKCPNLIRILFRVVFVIIAFFSSVALPFISSFSSIVGGLFGLPVTFLFPSVFYLSLIKPPRKSFEWYLNIGLIVFASLLITGVSASGVWSLLHTYLKFNFFDP